MNEIERSYFSLSIFKEIVPIVILSLSIFYACFIGNGIMTMVLTSIICLFLLFCRNEVLVPSMLYFCSFALMFQAGSYMLYEFLCIVFMCRVFITEKFVRSFLLFWFVIYFITHIISSSVTVVNIIPILYIITLIFACVSYNDQYDNCVVMYLLGVFVSSLLGFLKPLSSHLIELLSEDFVEGMNVDFIVRFSGLSYDPNFYTICVIISIMLLLFSRYKNTWLALLLASVYICLGMITYSKSYILSIVVIFLLYFLDGRENVSKKVFFFLALGYLVSASFFDEIVFVFKERFTESSNFNELTTGRDELWILYCEQIADSFETLFFGHGISTLLGDKAAHNTFIQILFSFGILGFIVDFLYIKKCFSILNYQGITMIQIGMIAVIFMLLFNLSAYTFPSLWMCLFMFFILISKQSVDYYDDASA